MSIEDMQRTWVPLSEELARFYEYARPRLLEVTPFNDDDYEQVSPMLDLVLTLSEQIRHEADAELRDARGAEYELASTMLLAAATVDAMLATDLATLDPDPQLQELGYVYRLAEVEGIERLDRDRNEVLDDTNTLFRGQAQPLGGAQGGGTPEGLINEVEGSIDALTQLALGPARDSIAGLVNAAGGPVLHFVTSVAHIEVTLALERVATKLARWHSPRFLREYVSKIVTLRAEGGVVDTVGRELSGAAEEAAVDQLAEDLANASRVVFLLTRIANTDGARFHASQSILAKEGLSSPAIESLEGELRKLEGDYKTQMKWAGRSARWLGRGGPILGHLMAPGVSVPVLCGVFFVGTGYVAYSLVDRIDERNLGFADHVEGVVRLVDRRLESP